MAYNIYFDGTLVSPDYIYELSREHNLFSDEFKLGGTPMAQYKMVVESSIVGTVPSVVEIWNGSNRFATLLVDNLEEEDEATATLTLVDYMAKFEFNYDGSSIMPTTLLAVVQNICSQAGVTLQTTNFTGYDKNIDWYDSRITAREYIGYVAELNGGYACMSEGGQLKFVAFDNTPVATISINDCENFKLGEQHIITRVLYDNEIGTYWEYGTTSGDTYYVDVNNVYITEESDIEAIYNVLNGYEYYSLTVDNCPINTAKIGETIAFTDGTNTYKTICLIDQTLAGEDWFGGYKLDVKSSTQAETKIVNTKTMIKTVETKVDREIASIETTVSSVEKTVTGDPNDPADNGLVGTVSKNSNSIQDLEGFKRTVEEEYATEDSVSQRIGSFEETVSGFRSTVTTIETQLNGNPDDPNSTGLAGEVTKLTNYLEYDNGTLRLGVEGQTVVSELTNTELDFKKGNDTKAWIGLEGLGTPKLTVGDKSQTANKQWRLEVVSGGSDGGLFFVIHRHITES